MQACISRYVSASLSVSGLRKLLITPLLFAALTYDHVSCTAGEPKERIQKDLDVQ
jgi:hypothetical protein